MLESSSAGDMPAPTIRSPKPFEPDGVLAGFPYRVRPDGSIDVIMQGAAVRFRDFDKFNAAIDRHSAI